jgi:hypothetical protein
MVNDYSIQPEFWLASGDMTIGVYVHEWGHIFGLPDLYDIDQSSAGIGRWGLMAYGSWNGRLGNTPAGLSAYSRAKLGATAVQHIVSAQWVTFAPGDIWRASVGSSGPDSPYYYLFEYRQRVGYDAYIPGEGLLIWRVNEDEYSNTREWTPDVGGSRSYRCALIQADSLWHLERRRNQGDPADAYPTQTVTAFTPETNPSTDWYTGAKTNLRVTDVVTTDSGITALIRVCDCGVHGDLTDDGILDTDDVWALVNILFASAINQGRPGCRYRIGDFDCSGFVDVLDLGAMVDYLYAGAAACDPCGATISPTISHRLPSRHGSRF